MCSLPLARYYIIKNAEQKAVYLKNDQLLAGEPGTENGSPERVCVLPNRALDPSKFPIIIGIQGGSRCLACAETGEKPTLQLEDVTIEDLYKGGERATRFTFYRSSCGDAFRLEAAARPGWFLCTQPEPWQPLALSREPGASTSTQFYFELSR
ncbi:interleukin-1 family member 10 [Tachyglossus aculeatus]|uniref:interleukin-1 family member 10 n=1 Tax=Tachyglossus aculeatus TaxID=9261 RepID=UPI0018F796C3|nr:interleukin-1 family member 10 [Tachyglossus aculeatus]